jgi:hypothetical protein
MTALVIYQHWPLMLCFAGHVQAGQAQVDMTKARPNDLVPVVCEYCLPLVGSDVKKVLRLRVVVLP